MKKTGKILTGIIFFAALAAFIISSVVLANRIRETNENKSVYEGLRQEKENVSEITLKELSEASDFTEEELEERDPDRVENLKAIYKMFLENNDMVGWITIDGTVIDYPVMQNRFDPEYYLKRDFYGKSSSYGSIYMDSACDINHSKNLILYGHHMRNGSMFAAINSYDSLSFYNAHKYIKFDTLAEIGDYEVVGAFKIKASDASRLQEIILFQSEEDFDEFKAYFEKNRFYDTGLDFSYEDSYLTLMTCEYTYQNGRFFVLAKKIEK